MNQANPTPEQATAHIRVEDLTMAYDNTVIQRRLNFSVSRGEVFVIMGPSGCGKSTLLRHMVGLKEPVRGRVFYNDRDFWHSTPEQQQEIMRKCGILYQSGALWSSMTLEENIAVPLKEYTSLSRSQIREVVALKLALVGLAGYEQYFPSEISGGMKKRAGLARAMALDPEILFFDEPSAGLDPISSRLLDDLILELSASLGTTIVVVSHELASIFRIADQAIFLDSEQRTMLACGKPQQLLESSDEPKVRAFLQREPLTAGGN